MSEIHSRCGLPVQSPLLWLTVTLLTYACADAVSAAHAIGIRCHPVLHSMCIIGAFLLLTGTSYTTYSAARNSCIPAWAGHCAWRVPLYENRKPSPRRFCRCWLHWWSVPSRESSPCGAGEVAGLPRGVCCRWRRNPSPQGSLWVSANPCTPIRR